VKYRTSRVDEVAKTASETLQSVFGVGDYDEMVVELRGSPIRGDTRKHPNELPVSTKAAFVVARPQAATPLSDGWRHDTIPGCPVSSSTWGFAVPQSSGALMAGPLYIELAGHFWGSS
jgi:hypothetical protein